MHNLVCYANLICMSNQTRTYLLIEERLDKSLKKHVTAARRKQMSWNAIARDLHTLTGVGVTSETLRTWFYGIDKPATPAASIAS